MSACFTTHVACSHQHCRRKSRERTFTGQGTAGLTRDHLQRDTRKDMTAVLRTVNEINSAQPVDVLHISSFTISSINSMTYHDILDLHHMYILSIMNVSQVFQTNVGSGPEDFFQRFTAGEQVIESMVEALEVSEVWTSSAIQR